MFVEHETSDGEASLVRQSGHPEKTAIELGSVLAALSDPVRMSIMCALSDGGERGWGEFCEPVAKSTLSHHMKVLREAGLILTRNEGTRCFVRRRDEIDELFPGLVSTVLELAHRERGRTGDGACVAGKG